MSVFYRPEIIARQYFSERLKDYRAAYNRVLVPTKFRPDFIFFGPKQHAVVVECDESNHERYNKSDEIYREFSIAKALRYMGYHPTVLRFTPVRHDGNRRFTTQLNTVVDVVLTILRGENISYGLRGVTVDDRRRLFTKIIVT